MNSATYGTVTGSTSGIALESSGTTLQAVGTVLVIRSAAIGFVTLTFTGSDNIGAWSRTITTLNLSLLAVGTRIRDIFAETSNSGITATFAFTGVVGSPVIDYYFSVE